MKNWFEIERPCVDWLVYGLLANGSQSIFVGKPKSGKSTAARNVAAAVVVGRQFLGRHVNVPAEGGRVLYIHLDRKDPVHDVVAEFKSLGLTASNKSLLQLHTAMDIPELPAERLTWLIAQLIEFRPHLVIVDLLFQFLSVKDSNSYTPVLNAVNSLQDALNVAKFAGHLIALHHNRKQESESEPFDDLMGSNAIRGSFSTGVALRRNRKTKTYTIMSDQTQREKDLGELPETVIERDCDTGELRLGRTMEELQELTRKTDAKNHTDRVWTFIQENPSSTQDEMMQGLTMAKKTLLSSLRELAALVDRSGRGVPGDPFKFNVKASILDAAQNAQTVVTQ